MITFAHEENDITRAIGISEAREKELDSALVAAAESNQTRTNSEVLEFAIKEAGVKKEAEYLYLGLEVGKRAAMSRLMHAMSHKAMHDLLG